MECSAALVRLIGEMPPQLTIRCIMTREPWNVSRARNLAIAQSEGEILVLLDADMLLPRSFLRTLDQKYRAQMHGCALVGQMLEYDAEQEVAADCPLSYEHYRDRHLAGNNRDGLHADARWTSKRTIPWSLCWTALIVIAKAEVEAHRLYFDQEFTGWGGEDLEWGYRIHRAGVAIIPAEELWGIHVPHARDVRRNSLERDRNYGRFLAKWPCFEVELVARFGDAAANALAGEHALLLNTLGEGRALSLLELNAGNARCIVLGAIIGTDGLWLNREEIPALADATVVRHIPILGMRLPYPSQSIEAGYCLSTLRGAPESIQGLIRSELRRVCLEAHYFGSPTSQWIRPVAVSG
jgi:hypothetical protein